MTQITKHKPIILTGFMVAVFLFIPTITNAAKTNPVPHASQAPYFDWRQPWQDTCEEASIIMIDAFYNNKKIDKKTAKTKMLDLLKNKNKTFGWSLDENSDKITKMINKFYNWKAKVIKKPTLEMIKEEIDNGRPVILPAYGKALKNPHFRNGGPDYHVFVISGYDDDKKEFIVQEPGTRYGLDFRYKYDTVMNAMHDFTGKYGKTKIGPKVAIFTIPSEQ